MKTSILDDHGQEFPRMDERRIGQRHRYGYGAGLGGSLEIAGGLLKHDLERGQTLARDDGAHRQYMEPVFVPRSDDADEDDGWVMAYCHDARENKAEVVVLHAQDFMGEPVARVHLPDRVPFGFHCNWVPDEA